MGICLGTREISPTNWVAGIDSHSLPDHNGEAIHRCVRKFNGTDTFALVTTQIAQPPSTALQFIKMSGVKSNTDWLTPLCRLQFESANC